MGSKDHMIRKTLFLAATPSGLSGAARIFDLGATFDVYNVSTDGIEADARALYSDWSVAGDDLRRAMREVEESEELECA
jgi:hypothetical protein